MVESQPTWAQEATVHPCRSANLGIIIVCLTRAASRSHFGICMALCTWEQERGALHTLILTDCEEKLSEEQSLALDNLRRCEESAWLGWDLRQMGSSTRLGPTVFAMSRARVWTNSFTVAPHVQQETIATRRAVAQRRARPLAGNSGPGKSRQSRGAICSAIARHGR